MKKISVLVLITVMDRAGAETLMMNYLRNINRDKIQMDFLINRPDKADYEDEIESLGSHIYHMCELYPGKFGRYKREFREFLKEHPEYKIIHSHLEERSYFALKIAKEMGVSVRIVHAHSVPKHFNVKLPVRLYFRYKLKGVYTHRFACGEAPAKWLYGTADDVIFMKNAVDTKEFSFGEAMRSDMRTQLNVSDDTLVIGHIGRFIYEKNQSFVIDIFNNVNKLNKNSRLLLIGGGKSKNETLMKEKIQDKVHSLGLDDKVMFLGVRDDINKIMQAMDVLVMPSFSEGFPVTLIEAQSSGLKCLVSEAVSHQCDVTGNVRFASLEESATEWAEKLLNVSQTDREKACEQVAQAGFDIKENAKWLEEFYEKAFSGI